MRILITGASGFIGSHLKQELERYSVDVFGVDKSDGDLLEPGVFLSHMEEYKPSVVIHLAAQVGRLKGEEDAVYTVRSNAMMTTMVARACGESGAKLLYASTSEVYGDFGEEWVDEGTLMHLPHNLYGLTKRWGEEACELYVPKSRLIHLRFSMPYGPGHPPGRGRAALTNFLWQAHHRKPIPVHRQSERSWCWIGDTARAVRVILHSGETGAFNVGRSDARVPMLTVAKMACRMAGAPLSLIEEVEPDGPQTLVKRLSTKRLESLGWSPNVQLEEGMVEVLKFVRRYDEYGELIEAAAFL